ncbi:hypothetical protein AB0I76_12250, partial [Micromonospora sp. NPDC049799]
ARANSVTNDAVDPVSGMPEIKICAVRVERVGEPQLRGYHPYPAARAELLHRLGRLDEAVAAYREALDLAGTAPERDRLRRKLDTIGQPD